MGPRRWPGAVVVAALAPVIALTWYAIAEYPCALRTPGVSWLLPGLGIVLCAYAVAAVVCLRRPASGRVLGVWFGLAAGLLWSAEITGGGPVMLSRPAEVAVGAVCALGAVAITLAAGITGAVRGGPRAGLATGGFAGLVSGLVVYLYAVSMTVGSLGLLATRTDYQKQFAASHAPSMGAFLVQDALTGYGAHLIINPALGLIGAGLGALAWLGHRRPAPRGRPAGPIT